MARTVTVLTTIAAIASALLCGLVLAPRDGWAGPRRLAVVVGANNGAAHRVRLRHAERDARKMADVLVELGGVASSDLTLLIGDPTAQDVLAALARADDMAKAVLRRGGEALIVLYYSGHATPEYLELSGTRLPLKLLRKRLQRSSANVRLAILDACHSGGAVRGKGGKRTKKRRRPGVAFSVDSGGGAQGYAIVTSSAATEESQESDELLGSFFTHHLVSGLRGAADRDRDNNVTLGEAYRYAYGRTLSQTARRARVAQHPHIKLALRGGTDVVLTSLQQARATLKLARGAEEAQWVVFQPSSGLVVAELDERPGQSLVVAVPVGTLEIYRRRGVRVARGSVETTAGGEIELSRAELKEVPLTAYLRKGETGVQLSAMVGIQSFLSAAVRDGFVAPAPVFSVEVRYQNLWLQGLDLAIDVAFTSGVQKMTIDEGGFSQRMTQLQVGARLLYRFDFDRLSLSLGPRAAFLWLSRAPSLEGVDSQSIPTLSAGATVGLWWRFTERLSIGLDTRISYVPLPISGLDGDHWLVEAQAAGAFHF